LKRQTKITYAEIESMQRSTEHLPVLEISLCQTLFPPSCTS
jgi:hypothetical protein